MSDLRGSSLLSSPHNSGHMSVYLRIQWPVTDGTIVKESVNAVSETLLDGKERHELTEKIKQITLSATRVRKCTEISGGCSVTAHCCY